MTLTTLPKSLCMAAALTASGAACQASVSLQFSLVSQQATNWANSAGEGGTALAWGIVVDRAGDGLATSYSPAGVNFGLPSSQGQSLQDASGADTDDVLFMGTVGMTLVKPNVAGYDGTEVGQNRITTCNVMTWLEGMDAGDQFYVIWFDQEVIAAEQSFGSPELGDAYGIYGNSIFTLPANGSTTSYASAFAGVDPLKTMGFTWSSGSTAIPEVSSAGLALLSAAGMLRRRRRN